MPLAGQGGLPGKAPVQRGLRPFPSTREGESSRNWRGQRVEIWGRRALSNTAKAVFGIPEFLQKLQTYSFHLLPQLKSFKEFIDFLQAPHYKMFLIFLVFALGTNSAGTAWAHAAQIQ